MLLELQDPAEWLCLNLLEIMAPPANLAARLLSYPSLGMPQGEVEGLGSGEE